MAAGNDASFAGFVELRCLCGRLHTLLRDAVLEGLGVSHWRCGPCKRRFVVACAPGPEGAAETYWPIFLDDVPSSGRTRQEGLSTDAMPDSPRPAALHFQCRCGCRLVGKEALYGRPIRCPRCGSRIVLNVGYAPEDGRPLALLEYRDEPPKP